jgi:hypothetical protein
MPTEEHRIDGEQLVAKVKEIIREGNARRLIIKGEDGHTVIEIPLTAGVVGAVLMPAMVAIGAIAALAARYTIVVVKPDAPAS